MWVQSLLKVATFLRLASLGGGPQAHVHMKGMKCSLLYLGVNVIMNLRPRLLRIGNRHQFSSPEKKRLPLHYNISRRL